MLRLCHVWRESTTFSSLARLPLRSTPAYAAHHVVTRDELARKVQPPSMTLDAEAVTADTLTRRAIRHCLDLPRTGVVDTQGDHTALPQTSSPSPGAARQAILPASTRRQSRQASTDARRHEQAQRLRTFFAHDATSTSVAAGEDEVEVSLWAGTASGEAPVAPSRDDAAYEAGGAATPRLARLSQHTDISHRSRTLVQTEQDSPAPATPTRILDSHDADDDDVVVSMPDTLLALRPGKAAGRQADKDGDDSDNSSNDKVSDDISEDLIDLVTDELRVRREAEVTRRRRVLYDLTHPIPSDYTYRGKLVPPPPLSFGKVTAEAKALGNEVMLGQHYQLVRQAGTRASAAHEATATSAAALDGGDGTQGGLACMIESSGASSHHGHGAGAQLLRTQPRYRSRKREANAFADHNYFFEINDLYQEVVLVGKANAGKSSLLNALLGQPVARSSSTPHTTKSISFYQSVTPAQLRAFHAAESHNLVKLPGGGLQLTFVDVPGFGIEGMSEAWRDAVVELTDAYFGVRRSVNTVLFCMDCERGLTKSDERYFRWLENVQGVFFVVLTKCDSVPHSRVCSVMRQVYALITRQRHKYRKVFPFILPTSAKDGTNIEELRGIIAETSGLVPGDRLRHILRDTQAAAMQAALRVEAERVQQARRVEREAARHDFLLTRGMPALPGRAAEEDACGATSRPVAAGEEAARTKACTPNVAHSSAGQGTLSDTEAARRQRRRFLAWRQANPLQRATTPYSAQRYRVNTGLENPALDTVRQCLTSTGKEAASEEADRRAGCATEDECAADEECSAPAPPRVPCSARQAPRVLGLPCAAASDVSPHVPPPLSTARAGGANRTAGPVSSFLDRVEEFGRRPQLVAGRRAAERELRYTAQRTPPRFLAQTEDGRLASFVAGRRVGPAVASPSSTLETRSAEWEALQLRRVLQRENAQAPWQAMQSLTRKVEAEKERAAMRGMKPKELAAYVRHAGRVVASFEKFEGEVSVAKFMNEVRQAPTLRSREQMHLNATAKISYRAMPPGLLKRYGDMDTYWPTPRVLGRQHDESHQR